MRNALAHAGNTQRRVVSAFVGTAFAQDDEAAAKAQWRQVADQLRPRVAKLAGFMDTAEADVLAYMAFPKEHRTKLHSNNPIERLNGEIKRRTEVVGMLASPAFGSLTNRPSFAWSAPSCSNRTTSGPSSGRAT